MDKKQQVELVEDRPIEIYPSDQRLLQICLNDRLCKKLDELISAVKQVDSNLRRAKIY